MMHRRSKRWRGGVRTWCIGAAAALFISGCATIGREFRVDLVRQIEIGRTTRVDVRDLFGEPWRTGLEDGLRTWTYGHYRYKLFGTARSRDLLIRFDENGVVRSYTFNSTQPEDAGL